VELPESSVQSEDVPVGGRGEGANADPQADLGAPDDVAAVMSSVARSLEAEDGVDETLRAITQAAVDTIPGVDWASITLVTESREVTVRAATDPLVKQIDEVQNATREGPCLEALWGAANVRVDDIAQDPRWPTWREKVVGLGAHSMLCFKLFASERLGALNLYAAELGQFDDESENIGVLFAAHAAVALASATEIDQLRAAVSTRDVIGQAKGILMERHKLTADEAFRLLVRASQESHIKLRDVAERVIERD
jgi:GAF domain-containing protein